MSRNLNLLAAAAIVGLAGNAFAVVTDGSRDAGYGAAKALQNVGTQFGNNTNPSVNTNGGSELDAGYGVVEGSNLHVFLAGNLESNFNKLEVFIDSVAGGQNQLRGDNPDVDFNGLNRMAGLKFDAAFASDFYLTTTGGNTGSGIQFFANFAETNTGGGGAGGFIGGTSVGGTVLNGSNGVNIGYDLSNVLGVGSLGNPFDSDPATVTTGIEMSIPLALIGNPTGDIRIAAFINGGSHDFLANQFLGGVGAGQGNLGEPSTADLSLFAGDQYFTVSVPEPTGLGAIALAAAGLVARRRK